MMNVLAVDTSGPVAGVAIWKNGAIAFDEAVVNKLTHSANLLPMIDEALQRTGLSLSDMNRLAVVVGPGPLRVCALGSARSRV